MKINFLQSQLNPYTYNINTNSNVHYTDNKRQTFKSSSFLPSQVTPLILEKTKNVTLENCLLLKKNGNFENYKKVVIDYFTRNNYKQYDRTNKNIIQYLTKAEDEDDFNLELEAYLSRIIDKNTDAQINILDSNKDKTEIQELCNDLDIMLGNVVSPVLKLLQNINKDPEVIKAKKEFDQKYGQDFVYLNNDIEFANACKEALNILEANNIPLKQINCIIASDYIDGGGICLNSDKGKVVVVNRNNWQVDNLLHTILHEILHTLQPDDIYFRMQTIPDEFKETADKVSQYACDNFAHEIHCELYVKKLTQGLNVKEEELFNYLGGAFL